MAETKQQCKWCLSTSLFISQVFTPVELRIHVQEVHPKITVMGTRHRCPHEACLDVDTTFDFAHEVREHLMTVHGGLVGAYKERRVEKKVKEVKTPFSWGVVNSLPSSASSANVMASSSTTGPTQIPPSSKVQETKGEEKKVGKWVSKRVLKEKPSSASSADPIPSSSSVQETKGKGKEVERRETRESRHRVSCELRTPQNLVQNSKPVSCRMQDTKKEPKNMGKWVSKRALEKTEETRIRMTLLQAKHKEEWEAGQLRRYGHNWWRENLTPRRLRICGAGIDPWRVYNFWDHVYDKSAYYERVHGYFGVVPDMTEEQWQAEQDRKAEEWITKLRANWNDPDYVPVKARKRPFDRNEYYGKERAWELRLREQESDRLALANARRS